MKSEKIYIEYLVLKVQVGEKLPSEKEVGDELFTLLHKKIKAFVLKILGGEDGVEDCVQITLFQVFNKLGQLKTPKAFHTWLYRVVYSSCMDHCRKSNRIFEAGEELTGDDSEVVDQQFDVKTAIAYLPEAQQAIVFLFYYEGFTVTQIAATLDQPAGTIKYQLFEVRKKIKKQLTLNDGHI